MASERRIEKTASPLALHVTAESICDAAEQSLLVTSACKRVWGMKASRSKVRWLVAHTFLVVRSRCEEDAQLEAQLRRR